MTGSVKVLLEFTKDSARFSVEDTGVGIPNADLPKIGQKFHRVSVCPFFTLSTLNSKYSAATSMDATARVLNVSKSASLWSPCKMLIKCDRS